MEAIEFEVFALANGVSDAEFLAADSKYQEHCYVNFPGLLRRTTARDGESWAVITVWNRPPLDQLRSHAGDAWHSHLNSSTYRREVFEKID